MEPSSEPRRHAQSPMSFRLFYYTAPWLEKSCLRAARARERRRLDHQGPRGTSHCSGAALGHPERPPGASQGPAGPHEGCVRGTASSVSRVNARSTHSVSIRKWHALRCSSRQKQIPVPCGKEIVRALRSEGKPADMTGRFSAARCERRLIASGALLLSISARSAPQPS